MNALTSPDRNRGWLAELEDEDLHALHKSLQIASNAEEKKPAASSLALDAGGMDGMSGRQRKIASKAGFATHIAMTQPARSILRPPPEHARARVPTATSLRTDTPSSNRRPLVQARASNAPRRSALRRDGDLPSHARTSERRANTSAAVRASHPGLVLADLAHRSPHTETHALSLSSTPHADSGPWKSDSSPQIPWSVENPHKHGLAISLSSPAPHQPSPSPMPRRLSVEDLVAIQKAQNALETLRDRIRPAQSGGGGGSGGGWRSSSPVRIKLQQAVETQGRLQLLLEHTVVDQYDACWRTRAIELESQLQMGLGLQEFLIMTVEEMIEQREGERQRAEDTIDEVCTALETAAKERHDLVDAAAREKDDLVEAAESEREALLGDIEQLEAEKQDLGQHMSELQGRSVQLQEELGRVRGALEVCLEKNMEAEGDQLRLNEEIKGMRRAFGELNAHLSEERERSSTYYQQLEDCKQSIENAIHAHQAASARKEQQLQTAMQQIVHLESEVMGRIGEAVEVRGALEKALADLEVSRVRNKKLAQQRRSITLGKVLTKWSSGVHIAFHTLKKEWEAGKRRVRAQAMIEMAISHWIGSDSWEKHHVLCAWRVCAREERRRRLRVHVLTDRRDLDALRLGFKAWRRVFRRKKVCRASYKHASEHLHMHMLRSEIAQWRNAISMQHFETAAVRKQTQRHCRRTLWQWFKVSGSQRDSKRIMLFFQKREGRLLAAGIVQRWVLHTKARRGRSKRLAGALRKEMKRAYQRAWCGWGIVVHRSDRLRHKLLAAEGTLLVRTLYVWRKWVADEAMHARSLEHLLETTKKLLHQILRAALSRWRVWARQAAHVHVFYRRLVRAFLGKAWQALRHNVAIRATQRRAIRKAFKLHGARVLNKKNAWKAWRLLAMSGAELRQSHARAYAGSFFRLSRIKRRAWAKWRAQRVVKLVGKEADKRMERAQILLLMRAFRAWRGGAHAWVGEPMLRYARRRSKRRFLARWRSVLVRSQRWDAARRKSAVIIERKRLHSLKLLMYVWYWGAEERVHVHRAKKTARKGVQDHLIHVMWQRRTSAIKGRVFGAWARLADDVELVQLQELLSGQSRVQSDELKSMQEAPQHQSYRRPLTASAIALAQQAAEAEREIAIMDIISNQSRTWWLVLRLFKRWAIHALPYRKRVSWKGRHRNGALTRKPVWLPTSPNPSISPPRVSRSADRQASPPRAYSMSPPRRVASSPEYSVPRRRSVPNSVSPRAASPAAWSPRSADGGYVMGPILSGSTHHSSGLPSPHLPKGQSARRQAGSSPGVLTRASGPSSPLLLHIQQVLDQPQSRSAYPPASVEKAMGRFPSLSPSTSPSLSRSRLAFSPQSPAHNSRSRSPNLAARPYPPRAAERSWDPQDIENQMQHYSPSTWAHSRQRMPAQSTPERHDAVHTHQAHLRPPVEAHQMQQRLPEETNAIVMPSASTSAAAGGGVPFSPNGDRHRSSTRPGTAAQGEYMNGTHHPPQDGAAPAYWILSPRSQQRMEYDATSGWHVSERGRSAMPSARPFGRPRSASASRDTPEQWQYVEGYEMEDSLEEAGSRSAKGVVWIDGRPFTQRRSRSPPSLSIRPPGREASVDASPSNLYARRRAAMLREEPDSNAGWGSWSGKSWEGSLRL